MGPAAGGTFAAAVSGNKTYAKIGGGAIVTAAKNVTVRAESKESLANVLASVSAALDKGSAAGVIGVLVSQSDTRATVGDGSQITATGGYIDVLALGDVKQIVAMAAYSGGTGKLAAGGTVNVGVFEQTVAATVGSFQTTAVDPDDREGDCIAPGER